MRPDRKIRGAGMVNEDRLEQSLQEFAQVADGWFENCTFVKKNYDFFRKFFAADNLEKIEWPDVQELGQHIHAFTTNSLARANAFGNPNYSIEAYRDTFSRLAHGSGSPEERMREFRQREGSASKYIGRSALSEIMGYLLADTHVFHNRRDERAAEWLGIKPNYKRGADAASKFIVFNDAIQPVIQRYREVVPLREGLPIGLQVDQFFSWLYETKNLAAKDEDDSDDGGSNGTKGSGPTTKAAFTATSFELLDRIHEEPRKAVYEEHKDGFVQHVENPLKQLLLGVIPELPDAISQRMETAKRLFSRFQKNDWGQGWAWDFYWGAIYNKGSKRTEGTQLFVWINHEQLRIGFAIGSYGGQVAERLARNVSRHSSAIAELLGEQLAAGTFAFGDSEHETTDDWKVWLAKPGDYGWTITAVLKRDEVLKRSADDLHQLTLQTFLTLFPFVVLATEDEPLDALAGYLGDTDDEPELNEPYSLQACSQQTGFTVPQLQTWVDAIQRKLQAVFYGPPGTGKTFVARELARHLIGGGDGFQELVQFHPAYEYEDFIQGIRPKTRGDGGLEYAQVPGRFLAFCNEAKKRTGTCVLIIDEINRANLSRVFGELMFLLEYRDQEVPLAGGRPFGVPKNVRLIGTMNTADRSIALVDHALRRRFAFLQLFPNYEILERFHADGDFDPAPLIDVLKQVNLAINDPHYEVGISFFLTPDIGSNLESIWKLEIEPYLEEYFFDQPDKVEQFRWMNVETKLLP